MSTKLSVRQVFGIQIILATLLFVSAFLQAIQYSQTVDEQISNRIIDATASLVEQNELNVYDWASWDDTVELVQRRYNDYFADNFNEDTSMIIQLAVVVDSDNVPVSGRAWNENANSFEALETQKMNKLVSLFQECGSSFMAALDETYLISSSFISPTERQDDEMIYGCLFFGKRMPDAKLSEIFANLKNSPRLDIEDILIQPVSVGESNSIYPKSDLIIQGSRSGLFGADVIVKRNKPALSSYQLLFICLYVSLLVAIQAGKNSSKID